MPSPARDMLVYDRDAVLHGEVWRLWTGHFVHFSLSHLTWDLSAVGLAGTWIELAGFAASWTIPLLAPPLIGLVLLICDPALGRFGGLSGLATALVAFASISEWRRGWGSPLIWLSVLAAMAAKIAWEYHTGLASLSTFGGSSVRNVPLSHVAGALAGMMLALAPERAMHPVPSEAGIKRGHFPPDPAQPR